jgi:hypothetical protein
MAPRSLQELIDSIFERVDTLPQPVRSELLESIAIMKGPAYDILRERHQHDQVRIVGDNIKKSPFEAADRQMSSVFERAYASLQQLKDR